MLNSISITILSLSVILIVIGTTKRFNRVDRERAVLHGKVSKLQEEKRMLEEYLDVHKEEYLDHLFKGKMFGMEVHSDSVIREKYIKNNKKK